MLFRLQFAAALLMLVCLSGSPIAAQQDLSKKQLEHADYDLWNTMGQSSISRDGKWALFSVQNGASDGEATLTIRGLDKDKQYTIERGSGARFTWDSNCLLYTSPSPRDQRGSRMPSSA